MKGGTDQAGRVPRGAVKSSGSCPGIASVRSTGSQRPKRKQSGRPARGRASQNTVDLTVEQPGQSVAKVSFTVPAADFQKAAG